MFAICPLKLPLGLYIGIQLYFRPDLKQTLKKKKEVSQVTDYRNFLLGLLPMCLPQFLKFLLNILFGTDEKLFLFGGCFRLEGWGECKFTTSAGGAKRLRGRSVIFVVCVCVRGDGCRFPMFHIFSVLSLSIIHLDPMLVMELRSFCLFGKFF